MLYILLYKCKHNISIVSNFSENVLRKVYKLHFNNIIYL